MAHNKTVLITGSAKRVGRELALHFAADGWNVVVHHHQSHNEATQLCQEIRENGGNAWPIKANLLDESETLGLLPAALAECDRIDCLINNASLFERDTLENITRESWLQHMDIHGYAVMSLSREFAKHCNARKVTGNIINIVDSIIYRHPSSNYFSYSLSKLLLEQLTEWLAVSLAPNIRVNAVAPGRTLPNKLETDANFAEAAAAQSLIQKTSSPTEVYQTIRFLLNSETITGEMIKLGK